MDDMELGQLCWAAYGESPGHHNAGLRALGAAARALLAKPEATREDVRKWMWECKEVASVTEGGIDAILAALSHFAPPARPKMMIEGMSVEQIKHRMFDALPGLLDGIQQATARDCAIEAYRLANTPAPEGDPDEEAKSFIEELRNYGFKWHGTVTPYWDDGPEEMRTFARKVVASRAAAAAKKEAGDG